MTHYWAILAVGALLATVLSATDSATLYKRKRKLPGQWCEWTSCSLGKCDPKREGYLTPSQMVETFAMGRRTVKYECWPMKPIEEDIDVLGQ